MPLSRPWFAFCSLFYLTVPQFLTLLAISFFLKHFTPLVVKATYILALVSLMGSDSSAHHLKVGFHPQLSSLSSFLRWEGPRSHFCYPHNVYNCQCPMSTFFLAYRIIFLTAYLTFSTWMLYLHVNPTIVQTRCIIFPSSLLSSPSRCNSHSWHHYTLITHSKKIAESFIPSFFSITFPVTSSCQFYHLNTVQPSLPRHIHCCFC